VSMRNIQAREVGHHKASSARRDSLLPNLTPVQRRQGCASNTPSAVPWINT
jgi:hypothetical protein